MNMQIQHRKLRHADTHNIDHIGPDAFHGIKDKSKIDGSYKFISLRSGISLTCFDVVVASERTDPAYSERCVALNILFEGNGESWLCEDDQPVAGPISLRVCRFHCMIANSKVGGINKFNSNSRFRGISIRIEKSVWEKMGGNLTGLPGTHFWTDFIHKDTWSGALPLSAKTRQHAKALNDILQKEMSDIKIELHCMEIIAEAIDTLNNDVAMLPSKGKDNRLVASVKEHIMRDLARDWKVADLVAISGVSEIRIRRAIRRITEMPPYAFVQETKLLRAHEMLNEGGETIASVAKAVGYNSQSHFSALFRRRFGICPSDLTQN